jgi:hypothetical protein
MQGFAYDCLNSWAIQLFSQRVYSLGGMFTVANIRLVNIYGGGLLKPVQKHHFIALKHHQKNIYKI